MERSKMESLFSPEEINELKQKTDQQDLEKFFFDIFVKNGDSEEDAKKTAQEWAEEIVNNRFE